MPRCIPSWTPFLDWCLVDVCSQLPLIGSKKQWFFLRKKILFETSKLTSICDPISVPTWLHSRMASQINQIPPKNRFQKASTKMIDFGIDCLDILAPFWDPSWGHVGHFFDQNEAALWDSVLFFDTLTFFSDLFAVLTSSWPHFGCIGPHLGSILEVLSPCWHNLGAMLGIKVISGNKDEHSWKEDIQDISIRRHPPF